jgi:hypothetical protein
MNSPDLGSIAQLGVSATFALVLLWFFVKRTEKADGDNAAERAQHRADIAEIREQHRGDMAEQRKMMNDSLKVLTDTVATSNEIMRIGFATLTEATNKEIAMISALGDKQDQLKNHMASLHVDAKCQAPKSRRRKAS